MRLTLRTLLAYLDDTLDPNQTKLIGQKVAESPAAQEIIAKIKDVVRRRRLTTPNAKLEANSVAEYIDNILPSDQLGEFEEICLESDVNLAEVAACHQILTVILSEPALVPPTAKRRMYGLIKGREAIPYRKAPSAPEPVAPRMVDGEQVDRHTRADDTLLLGMPFMSRQSSWLRKLMPVGAVLLLLVGLVVAITKAMPGKITHNQVADVGSNKLETKTDKVDPKSETKPETPVEPKKEEKTGPKEETKIEPREETKPEVKPGPGVDPKPESKAEIKPPSPNRVFVGKYAAAESGPATVLIQKKSDKDPWVRVKPRGFISTNDLLVSLPGYQSEVQLDSGVNLLMWGNLPDPFAKSFESVATLHENPDMDLDMTLGRGRIAITNNKQDGPANVRVRFMDEVWDLGLQEPKTEVMLDLFGIYPPGVPFSKKADAEGPGAFLFLIVLKGQADLKVRFETQLLRERSLFTWDNQGPAPRPPTALDKLPSWTDRAQVRTKLPQKMKWGLDNLAAKLNKNAPVEVVLSETLNDPDPVTRELTVFGLGATDDLKTLLDALGDEQHPEVREAAIRVLQTWIAHKAGQDMKLYKVLEKKYGEVSAETIMVLLHWFSKNELAEPATYDLLISDLKHNKLPIRQLAFMHLRMLVPEAAKKIPYDPAGASDQLEKAYDEWKKVIPDGQLPPRIAGGAGPAPK